MYCRISAKYVVRFPLPTPHSSISLTLWLDQFVDRRSFWTRRLSTPLTVYVICMHFSVVCQAFSQCAIEVQLYFPIFVVVNLTNAFSELLKTAICIFCQFKQDYIHTTELHSLRGAHRERAVAN